MKIILVLFGMLLTCWSSGVLLIFALRGYAGLRRLALHIGYAYTLIAFYVFYMQLNSVFTATISTLALPFLLAAISLPARARKRRSGAERTGQHWIRTFSGGRSGLIYPVAAGLIVVLLAAWPYLLSGWGNYYHSGNYDMEDGLNGRDAYVNNLILGQPSSDTVEFFKNNLWYDFASVINKNAQGLHRLESYRQWFAGDEFRFQYSSLAFWSTLLHEYYGIDVFLVQAILNLMLMTAGIYYLARHAFSMTPLPSAVGSVVSVSSTFYLATYFSGHEGSLMYGALIPALLYFVLVIEDAGHAVVYRWIFGGLVTGAIAFTYAQPLGIIFPILFSYKLFSIESFRRRVSIIRSSIGENRRNLCFVILALIIVAAVALTGLWHATEAYRLRQYAQYRAMGYTHDWLIVPLFLGLIPSPTAGSIFVGHAHGMLVYWVLVTISCLIAGVLGFLLLKSRPPTNTYFFLVFGLFWIAEFLIFRFFIVDSYYIYKFLYVHQFIIVIGIVAYIFQARSPGLVILCTAIVMANLVWDVSSAYGIFCRPYNRDQERYTSLLKLDHSILRKSFVGLTGGAAISLRQTLKAHGLETTLDPRLAEYFIVPAGRESDVTGSQFTERVAEVGGLAIMRAPRKNYLMIRMTRNWNEPEVFPSDPVLKNTVFRWVGKGMDDNLGIYVVRPGSIDDVRGQYLRMCFQKGPSAEGDINLTVSSAGKDVLGRFTVGNGVHCEWIPAERVVGAEQPLVIRSGAKGRSLLPFDDKILLYRVFAVGWSDRMRDERSMSFFNADHDIVGDCVTAAGETTSPSASLCLGRGWEAFESFGGEHFRWVGGPAELILAGNGSAGTADAVLDLEPGPSHGVKPLEIEVLDEGGNVVATGAAVTGRNTVILPLSHCGGRTSVYTLRAQSDNLPVPGDPRTLNYRVFSIRLRQ